MIKFLTGETVETISISVRNETLAGFNRSTATIVTTGIDYATAAALFADGAAWDIVDGEEIFTQWEEYTKAGPITDNRDGTLTIKMGMADTSEQVALREAKEAKEIVTMTVGKSITSVSEAESVRGEIEAVFAAATLTDDKKIRASYMCKDWVAGNHTVGETYNAIGQTWECYQAYDNSVYPGVTPGNPSWYTFNRPLHGKTPETARPFVPVQGSHDMYRGGEYMIFTDNKVYRCKSDTNYSPTDYAAAWEVVE